VLQHQRAIASMLNEHLYSAASHWLAQLTRHW
jgi:hypothetical protein